MSGDWPLNDLTVTSFKVTHNFGHYAHMVEWYFVCIHPDANMHSDVGDKMGLENSQDLTYGTFHSTTNAVIFAPAGVLADGSLGPPYNLGWSFWRKDGTGAANLSSFTNYMLHVDFCW
jgi:hypothetical protein